MSAIPEGMRRAPFGRYCFSPGLSLTPLDKAGLALFFVTMLGLYLHTSPPGVAMEDDGLFVMGSYFYGLVHPPGYPLHTLLGKLFTLLPFGSAAFRVHALSALFGALTCVMLWLVVRCLVPGRIPAYSAALALGLSNVFWSQSIIAEVYTLNTFFFFLLAWLVLRANAVPLRRLHSSLLLTALVYGLSLSNHWPLIILSTPTLLLLMSRQRLGIAARRILVLLLAVAIGLTPYLLLVLRSWMDPPISFLGPIESWQEFWFTVSRRGYAGVDQSVSSDMLDKLEFGSFLFRELGCQFTWAGGVLVLTGFVTQWRAWPLGICIGLTIGFLSNSLLLVLLLGFDYDPLFQAVFRVYPLIAYGIMALWLALGIYALARFAGRHADAAASLLTAALAVMLLVVNYPENDRHRYRWAGEYAEAVLQGLAPNAILFVRGDFTLPVAYQRLVEQVRPDVTVYSSQGLIFSNRLFKPHRTPKATERKLVRDFVRSTARPVYFTARPSDKGQFVQHNWLVHRVYPDDTEGVPVLLLNEQAATFARRLATQGRQQDPWSEQWRSVLLNRLGYLLEFGRIFPAISRLPASLRDLLPVLEQQFYGRMGMLKARMEFREQFADGNLEGDFRWLEERLPRGSREKRVLADFFALKGDWMLDQGRVAEAVESYSRALAGWFNRRNRALLPLLEIYADNGSVDAFERLTGRIYGTDKLPAKVQRLQRRAIAGADSETVD